MPPPPSFLPPCRAPWASRPAHGPARTARPGGATLSAGWSASACPRPLRARQSGWNAHSSESPKKVPDKFGRLSPCHSDKAFSVHYNLWHLQKGTQILLQFRHDSCDLRDNSKVAKDSDRSAGAFETEKTGGVLAGLLAEE